MRSVVAARLPALVGPRDGSGPPLLLLPGLAAPSRSSARCCRRWPCGTTCWPSSCRGRVGHPPCPPPSGRPSRRSPTPWNRSSIGGGVTVPHVLGVSLGGRLGLELARRQR